MLPAIGNWPFPQKRPGASPSERLPIGKSAARSNEQSNRLRASSPELALEPSPRTAIAVRKVVDSR